ncbi:hypothetical protein P170DRAFT_408052 [Aspergillus steynii IBT 23096]|uniref:Protein kinase domain-containing protein n=1 Tax=Aspergillus steynii IBT 23096 TaxID=1392250 RepID=A0A2I2G867_9EURO|nr:uncharacterized protein P170DRAFT_408052 [Aspergillus steynii IBT 23096]PLB49076.1 hypothetical protein P170DRAFT_408052 [Aspergillus steynii IBT 23096]
MADEYVGINPSDVTFLELLQESKNSAVFKVRVRGRMCVMKVYHDRGLSECDPPDYDVNLFSRESSAYRRMKERGLYRQGVVPDFYGTITQIQPTLWPSLHMFLQDKLAPNAVLIEYIPDAQQIDLSNFSKDYLVQLRDSLYSIHQAGVLHGDPKPRNMIISRKQNRVLWIDFDSAQTFSGNLSPRQNVWFKEENETMEYFIKALTQDHVDGRLSREYSYYYGWFPC